jgi:hypothetical protein
VVARYYHEYKEYQKMASINNEITADVNILNVDGDQTVTGSVAVGDNLTVSGLSSLQSVGCASLTTSGDLSVSGSSSLQNVDCASLTSSGNVKVSGSTTTNSISCTTLTTSNTVSITYDTLANNAALTITRPAPTIATRENIEPWVIYQGTSSGEPSGTLTNLLMDYAIYNASWFPIPTGLQVVTNFRASQSDGYNVNLTHDSSGNFFIQNSAATTTYPLWSTAAGNLGLNTYTPSTSYSITAGGTFHAPSGLSVPTLFQGSSTSGTVMASLLFADWANGAFSNSGIRTENFNTSAVSVYNQYLCIPYTKSYSNPPVVSVTQFGFYSGYTLIAYSSSVTSVSSSTLNFGVGGNSVLVMLYSGSTATNWSSLSSTTMIQFQLMVLG